MTAPITIESAREAAAPLLRGERDGWVDLPCGGGVFIEKGCPVRLSDAAMCADRKMEARIRWEAERATDMILSVGDWYKIAGSTSEYSAEVYSWERA